MPEKSGIDVALCVALLAGGNADGTACPKAGVAAANVTSKMKYRRCTLMTSPNAWFAYAHTDASILYEDENGRRYIFGNAGPAVGGGSRRASTASAPWIRQSPAAMLSAGPVSKRPQRR